MADDVPVLRLISRLAAPHGGCVTTASLGAAGVGKDQIDSLIERGALTRVVRSVYVVGAESVTHAQLVNVALLRAGENAHLIARSSAEASSTLAPNFGVVSVARTAKRIRPPRHLRTEIVVAETGEAGRITLVTVPEREAVWESAGGVPAEPLARALARLADAGDHWSLRRAWREGDYLRILLRPSIEDEIGRGAPGSKTLATLLADQPPREVNGAFRSRAEMRLWDALMRRGLPSPAVNHLTEIGGGTLEPDFFFVLEQLIVEADGPQHRLPTRAAEDARRDAHVRAHRVEVLRFPNDEIDADADACAAAVERALLARRRPPQS